MANGVMICGLFPKTFKNNTTGKNFTTWSAKVGHGYLKLTKNRNYIEGSEKSPEYFLIYENPIESKNDYSGADNFQGSSDTGYQDDSSDEINF